MSPNVFIIMVSAQSIYKQTMNNDLLKGGFGWRMLTYLKKNNVKYSDLAKPLDMTRSGVYLTIKNEKISLRNYALIASYFNKSMDQLADELMKVERYEYDLLIAKESPAEYAKKQQTEIDRLKAELEKRKKE